MKTGSVLGGKATCCCRDSGLPTMAQPSPVIITLFDQGEPQWQRNNVLSRPPRLIPPEEKTWRTAFDDARATQYDGGDLPEGIDDVRCWPVHEPGWRREILRTRLEGW